jgi:glycine/D-amino acid oxidase-like deaminating enzyme
MPKLPSSSKTVIIGGGIIGCSTAYHLAKIGVETILLEGNCAQMLISLSYSAIR